MSISYILQFLFDTGMIAVIKYTKEEKTNKHDIIKDLLVKWVSRQKQNKPIKEVINIYTLSTLTFFFFWISDI